RAAVRAQQPSGLAAHPHSRSGGSAPVMSERSNWRASFGAVPAGDSGRFRIWASAARRLTLLVRRGDTVRRFQPERDEHGMWEVVVPSDAAPPGARYAYGIDDRDPLPDQASRFLPDGVHGWSEVIDAAAFAWHDAAWSGIDPHRLVIYELHVGAFAPAGTFAGVTERLEYLRDLGITALELMPLADFPARRDWGYDGVSLFAPCRAYGRP